MVRIKQTKTVKLTCPRCDYSGTGNGTCPVCHVALEKMKPLKQRILSGKRISASGRIVTIKQSA